MSDLILVAASGLAREVAEAVYAAESHRITGIVDDDRELHGTNVAGIPVLGGIAELDIHPGAQIIVCAGSGTTRRTIVQRLEGHGIHADRYATVIHPSVALPKSCSIGRGTVLLAQVAVTAEVNIGHHVVAMPNVTLTHDNVIGDFTTLCAGVSLAGMVTVGEGAYLGTNASVREHVQVGTDSVLGMGAALVTDLPAGEVWAGVPAHRLGRNQVRLKLTHTLEETS